MTHEPWPLQSTPLVAVGHALRWHASPVKPLKPRYNGELTTPKVTSNTVQTGSAGSEDAGNTRPRATNLASWCAMVFLQLSANPPLGSL